jgi:hypothetical protein
MHVSYNAANVDHRERDDLIVCPLCVLISHSSPRVTCLCLPPTWGWSTHSPRCYNWDRPPGICRGCNVSTCDGSLFSGVSNDNGTLGSFIVGEPAYGVVEVLPSATNPSSTTLGLSMIGSDPVYAFIGALANNFTTVTAAIDNLCVSTEEDNLCGAFATDCRVVLDTTDTVVGSLRYELTYRGPPDYASLPFNCNAGEPCPTAWGVFNRTGVAYSDATCTVAVLTFSEQGALANLGHSLFGDTPGSANAYGKFPRTIDVTPLDADTAADLQLQCPCSTSNVASWTANTARTITYVP